MRIINKENKSLKEIKSARPGLLQDASIDQKNPRHLRRKHGLMRPALAGH
jgi:hypothetical protein